MVGDPEPETCPHCDFGSGQRGMDSCGKCRGTGSVFRVVNPKHPHESWIFPNTKDGFEKAVAKKIKLRNFREIGTTERGYTIFVEDNPVGGHTYWSDEIGGGVMVWDTCLVSLEALRLAIKIETEGEHDVFR